MKVKNMYNHFIDGQTRLFFVVSSNSQEKELFITYEDACDLINTIAYNEHPNISIAKVKNAYFDEDLKNWKCEDTDKDIEVVQYQ